MTKTYISANFAEIGSLEELAEITWHFLQAIEEAFDLGSQWSRVPAEGVEPDEQGLGPADTNSIQSIAEFLAERGWNDRFLHAPSERTGRSLNDTFFVQFQPEICEMHIEHHEPALPGGWEIWFARHLEEPMANIVRCCDSIHEQNKWRRGMVRCSAAVPQKRRAPVGLSLIHI